MTDDTPGELRLNYGAGVLDIAWHDGTRDSIAFSMLRAQCRCAECRSARQQDRAVHTATLVTLSEVIPYGPNAVQLFFSDGHTRGIFPFSYLRELASRAATTADTR